MKYFFILIIWLGLYISAAAQTGSNTYALVVGISHYGNGIESLQYANRDAAVFADFLRSKAGGAVPSENIRFLQDSTASSGALYEGLYWLTKVAKENDLVYIYFSGHGDIDGDLILKNGYLLCYNSPPSEYINFALSVSNLNEYANTLSAGKKANVVLITDACHSDKISSAENRGPLLEGLLGKETEKKEVRISSCQADELSAENEAWGGGRGVFSYYLVNGLKGLADKSKDGMVTLEEIKSYMASSFAGDALIQREKIKQTPSLNGRDDFVIAKVDETAAADAAKEIADGQAAMPPAPPISFDAEITADASEYFFERLSKASLEQLTHELKLNEIKTDSIAAAIIGKLRDTLNKEGSFLLLLINRDRQSLTATGQSEEMIAMFNNYLKKKLQDSAIVFGGIQKLNELQHFLYSDTTELQIFNARLAVSFDDKGQEAINQYLSGDAAELEKRRYYNVHNSGYELYSKMFAIALRLTPKENIFLQDILKVKLHYFAAVAARIKTYTVENPTALLNIALKEINEAEKLEKNAAYIYNELGNILLKKGKDAEAEKNYFKAIKINPDWAIPWSNLAGIFILQNKIDKSLSYLDSAKKRQNDLQDIETNSGIVYARKGKLLMAEELFRKAIKINSRYFLPFENLGYVYNNTTQYAMADSFFFESELRKKGYHFGKREVFPPAPPLPFGPTILCPYDTLDISKTDAIGQLVWGKELFDSSDFAGAEKHFKISIANDKKNPLAFHYLGKLLYLQKRWQEGEIIFKMALQNALAYNDFINYIDSLQKYYPASASKECIIENFKRAEYPPIEDNYFIASLYEQWNHYAEAEQQYIIITTQDSSDLGGYIKLWTLMEKLGRYDDAENFIKKYSNAFKYNYNGDIELHGFYERMIGRFPKNGMYYYKQGKLLYGLAALSKYSEPYTNYQRELNESKDKTLFNELNISDTSRKNSQQGYKFKLPGTEETVQSSPPIHTPYSEEGIAYLKKANQLITEDGERADINNKIGDMYWWLGLPDSAGVYYFVSVNIQPDNAGIREKLIDCYAAAYLYSDALTQLDSLYRRKEINFSKQLLFAQYKIHDGLFGAAQSLLNDAEKVHPYVQQQIIDLNGRLNLLSDNPKKAIEYYSRLITINKKDSCVMYTIARLYAKLGNKTEAIKWRAAAIKYGFRFSYALEYDTYFNKIDKPGTRKQLFKEVDWANYPDRKPEEF